MNRPQEQAQAALPIPTSSAWAPLRHREFLALWTASFAALIGSWMSDSSAAWLMTTLATSPLQVALVQAAMLLPVVLLGLPAGALADLVDRRMLLIVTQFWVGCVALVLFAVTLLGRLTPELLLLLTFGNGIGMAMRMPALSAMIPDLIPRPELGRALALNSVAMNGSRIVGPIVAGVLFAWWGGEWVFLVYGVMSVLVALRFMRWKRSKRASSLPSERFVGAMRLGVQFAMQTPLMVAVILRSSVFSFFGMAILALLPLVARVRLEGNANTYTMLLAAVGAGAIMAVALLPYLRRRLSRDRLVAAGTVLQAFATIALAEATSGWTAALAALLSGAAWMAVMNALAVAAQISLPDWVRARGLAVYQVCGMAFAILGSVVWGLVAAIASIEISLMAAGVGALIALALAGHKRVGGMRELDLTPVRVLPEFVTSLPIDNDQGPVLVGVEYRIDPLRAEAFIELMAESRRWRLRMGAVHWGLLHDIANPGRFVEQYVMESWVDRLRQIERLTAEDIALRDRKNEFHLGPKEPEAEHFLLESTRKN